MQFLCVYEAGCMAYGWSGVCGGVQGAEVYMTWGGMKAKLVAYKQSTAKQDATKSDCIFFPSFTDLFQLSIFIIILIAHML